MPFLGKKPTEVTSPVDINSGSIDGTTIGGGSAAPATVTTFTSTGIDDNADATAITINSSEQVGIGTSSPNQLLTLGSSTGSATIGLDLETSGTVRGSILYNAGSGEMAFTSGYSGYGGYMTFDCNGAERMRIDTNGDVGIGISDPLYKLQVAGATSDADGALGSQAPQFSIQGGNTNNQLEFGMDNSGATAIGFIQSRNLAAGAQTISLNPKGGIVTIGSGGLTFNGDTAAANALNDYEEGTWTPYLEGYGQSTPLSQTYSSQIGLYRKVGNLIYVSYRITLTSKGNMSGNYLLLKGLPYSIGGSSHTGGYGGINYFNNLSQSVSSVWWEIGAGTTNSMWLAYRSGAGTGSSYASVNSINSNFYMTGSAVYYT